MFLEISLPTGFVLASVKTRIEKTLLFPTYAASHRKYMNREGFLRRWEELGNGLSVSLHLPTPLEHDRVPCAHIAVRNDVPGRIVDRVDLLVEAEGPGCVFQERASAFRLDDNPRVLAMPTIPLRWLEVTEHNSIIQSFKALKVWVLPIEDHGDANYFSVGPALWLYSGVTDLLNERFEQRWGAFWNLGAVDAAIREKRGWFVYHLATPRRIYARRDQIPWTAILSGLLRALFGRPLCWILTRRWLLSAYFWVPIFLRRGKVSDDIFE